MLAVAPKIARPENNVNTQDPKSELRDILLARSVRQGNFTLASGKTSDFYVDAKQTTSDPRGALLVGKLGWDIIRQKSEGLGIQVDGIGGLTMGADWIALSIGIAARLDSA